MMLFLIKFSDYAMYVQIIFYFLSNLVINKIKIYEISGNKKIIIPKILGNQKFYFYHIVM